MIPPLIDAAALRALTPYPALIAAMAPKVVQPLASPERHVHDISGQGDALLIMPAWRPDGILVIKLVTAYPNNPARNLPTIAGVVAVFDAPTGAVITTIDGTELTARRTAAAAALAASKMMRADSRRLAVIGTGALSAELAEAHLAIHDFADIEIVGRSPDKAAAVAAELRARTGREATASTDISAAVARADVIAAATTATVPFIRAADVRPGTHIGAVGAFTPKMAEIDGDTLKRATLYADSFDSVLIKGGEVVQALNAGLFERSHIRGGLADILTASGPIRTSADEITVFKSVGYAALDLAIAEFVVERSR
jgi:ornithine cyclodeaminase